MHYRLLSLLIAAVIAFGIVGCGGSENNSADPLGTDALTLTSSATSVDANGTVVLTATVLNASGVAVVGREVSFGFVANASGAVLYAVSARTNAAGEATVTYKAGAVKGVDILRASISNGVSDAGITVSVAGGTTSSIATISSLSASMLTVSGGQMSLITATLSMPTIQDVSKYENITFTIPVNNSGASFIDSTGASVSTISISIPLADSFNDTTVMYKAGTNVSSTEVDDIVRAVLGNGSTRSILITRTAVAGVGGTGNQLAFEALPTTLPATGGNSVLTATVTSENGSPVANEPVGFTILTGPGVLSAASVYTDTNGVAWVIFTGGATPGDTAIQAKIIGRSKALVISW